MYIYIFLKNFSTLEQFPKIVNCFFRIFFRFLFIILEKKNLDFNAKSWYKKLSKIRNVSQFLIASEKLTIYEKKLT